MAGLYGKYKIKRADGTAILPEARYFILRYDNDRCARVALMIYAEKVADRNRLLAADLIKALALAEQTESEKIMEEEARGG